MNEMRSIQPNYQEFGDVVRDGASAQSMKARGEINRLSEKHGLVHGQREGDTAPILGRKGSFRADLPMSDDIRALFEFRRALVEAGLEGPAIFGDPWLDVPSAITAEEWENGQTDREHVLISQTDFGLVLQTGGDSDDTITVGQASGALAALIALANDARADSDRGKITREDLDELKLVALKYQQLLPLASKLEAILRSSS